MLVPNDKACENQFSSTTPIPASETAAGNAWVAALQNAVGNAQTASDALLVANPWESWRGGLNLMRDIQRGNTQVALPGGAGVPVGAPQLPGLPPAGSGAGAFGPGSLFDRFMQNLAAGKIGSAAYGGPGGSGSDAGSRAPADGGAARGGWMRGGIWNPSAGADRSANARQKARGWGSRFVTGPGGKFQTWPGLVSRNPAAGSNAATLDCATDAADVIPSDGIMPAGEPEPTINEPPANPPLRSDQPQNIIVAPPAAYASAVPVRAGAGMGEWSASLAQPGAVPALCTTGAPAQSSGVAGLPWWLWALAGIAVVAVAADETKSRRAGAGQKRAA